MKTVSLGEKVKAQRESKGYTRQMLSAKAAISPMTLYRIENNIGTANIRTLKVIAQALGVKLKEIQPERREETR